MRKTAIKSLKSNALWHDGGQVRKSVIQVKYDIMNAPGRAVEAE